MYLEVPLPGKNSLRRALQQLLVSRTSLRGQLPSEAHTYHHSKVATFSVPTQVTLWVTFFKAPTNFQFKHSPRLPHLYNIRLTLNYTALKCAHPPICGLFFTISTVNEVSLMFSTFSSLIYSKNTGTYTCNVQNMC